MRRRELERREARALARLIREQERAAAQAEQEAREEARRARRREYDRQRREQARREQEEQEAKAAARRERRRQYDRERRAKQRAVRDKPRLERLANWFEREAEKEAKREAERQRKQEIKEWEATLDAERKARGMTQKQRRAARKQDREAKQETAQFKTIEEYIVESLQAIYECMKGLGYKVDEPVPFKYQDGSFDAEICVHDPDDTTGAGALLDLEKCIQPVVGAWILIGFRHYPSFQTERRIEKASIGGKPLPGSLMLKEGGFYVNMTNYRLAGQSEIADHVNATHKWLVDFGRANQAWCAQIFVRYFYSPKGHKPA